MTVSMEHSTIQYNSLQSAIINAQVEEFLRKGGEISSTAPFRPAPRPFGRQSPEVACLRRVEAKKRVGFEAKHSPELIKSIKEMSVTMTQEQVAEKTGLNANQLYSLANFHDFRFKAAENSGHSNLLSPVIDEVRDLQNVERMKALRDVGVTRRQAARHMGIGNTMFSRLLRDYSIDYPKAIGGKR